MCSAKITTPPQVTVGVCVRNGERFIEDAIDSLILQDFPHDCIRVVFVDDGSEDKTLSIIQRRIKAMDMKTVVQRTSWKGTGNARNIVIANAEGDYLLWLDADMILSRDYLSRLVDFMEHTPKAGIVKGRVALVPARNLLATLECYSRAVGKMVDYQSEKGRLKTMGTGGALYRMEAIRQSGGFDVGLRGYNEDWDIELRVREAGWSLHSVNVFCYDYERYGMTWKELWQRYWIRGYHTHYFLHKRRGLIKHHRNFPPAAFLFGLYSSFTLFRLTRNRAVFLMAFPYTVKMIAWYFGFIRSHYDGYAPIVQKI
jgi:glycosyltransferase involved in cell wall biosynthesis